MEEKSVTMSPLSKLKAEYEPLQYRLKIETPADEPLPQAEIEVFEIRNERPEQEVMFSELGLEGRFSQVATPMKEGLLAEEGKRELEHLATLYPH